MRGILEMTKGLNGNNVTCDNIFTSYTLSVELRKKNFTLLDTPELPRELLLLQGRVVNSSRYAFSEDLTIVARMPKDKNVLALSAMYNNTQVSDGKDSKPDIIVHYNNTKSSVDNLDQVTSAYSQTLPKTAAAKTAVERLRQEAEQPSTSISMILYGRGDKKRA
ncbi:hypothetical protein T01_13703 [Trichinella spiralis]|uniref:PiggyBac transposable element-derived protein domain-containing protein n=1 Tax=Trichinella spiralis TaxID=6334 RepID=A0A0V1BZ97_TRISP|nr:hypothetical protein T01_13703 [Trichinella spiralis]